MQIQMDEGLLERGTGYHYYVYPQLVTELKANHLQVLAFTLTFLPANHLIYLQPDMSGKCFLHSPVKFSLCIFSLDPFVAG